MINIDKGIEAIDESILSLNDKIKLNSAVRKIFADKVNAQDIMANEIFPIIEAMNDPFSIDVINEIMDQYEKIINEFC